MQRCIPFIDKLKLNFYTSNIHVLQNHSQESVPNIIIYTCEGGHFHTKNMGLTAGDWPFPPMFTPTQSATWFVWIFRRLKTCKRLSHRGVYIVLCPEGMPVVHLWLQIVKYCDIFSLHVRKIIIIVTLGLPLHCHQVPTLVVMQWDAKINSNSVYPWEFLV